MLVEKFDYYDAPLKLHDESLRSTILYSKEDCKFICLHCGETFTRRLEYILRIIRNGSNKAFCTQCSKRNFHEEKTRFILESLLKNKFPQERPQWLRGDKQTRPYELDGYCKALNLAFEYQGEQHFTPIRDMTQEDVEEIQRRDALKVNICKEKGTKLIVVDHESRSGVIEKQIRTSLKRFKFKIKEQNVDWSKFKVGTKLSLEEKADLHSTRMGYRLRKPEPMTASAEDFSFHCEVDDHSWFHAKSIDPSKSRPACKECGHLKRVNTSATKSAISTEQLSLCASECSPPMNLLEWAGMKKKKRLYECSCCKYVFPYTDRTIREGKQESVCMKCKPKAKPRVQLFSVLEKAFSLGGACKLPDTDKVTKQTQLTFKCFNEGHPEFSLTVGQFLESDMWCTLPTCDNRKSKKAIVSSDEISQKIASSYPGLRFLVAPTPGQSTPLELDCAYCGQPVFSRTAKKFTYKNLRKMGDLECQICQKILGRGWFDKK